MTKPDWADDVAYQSVRREIAEGTYSVELDILAAALRKAKADGMREAANMVSTIPVTEGEECAQLRHALHIAYAILTRAAATKAGEA